MLLRRLPTRLLLLAAAVLLCAAGAAVAAVPAVTGASCAGGVSAWCTTGATVTLTGTDLAAVTAVTLGMTPLQQANVTCAVAAEATTDTSLSCKLSVVGAFEGSYPIVLTAPGADASPAVATYVGDLLVGAFYEQSVSSLPQWSAAPASGVMDVSEVLTAIAGDGSIATGGSFTMYGNFSRTATYELYLYNAQSPMVEGSPGLPVCSNAKALTVTTTGRGGALPNTLVCEQLTTVTKAMGMYGYLVYNTVTKRYVYGGGSLYRLDVQPPLPTVSSVSASCPGGASSCSSSVVSLTLTGTNMNVRTPPASTTWTHFVNFTVDANPNGLQPDASISCTTTGVSEAANTATLALTVSSDVLPGAYPLYVVNQVCNMGMTAPPVWVGNLVLGPARTVTVGAVWETVAGATNGSYVAGAAPSSVESGATLTLYGTFADTTASRYEVHFVDGSSQALQTGASSPTCTGVTVTATALRCTYTARRKGALTSLAPMVYDTASKAYLPNRLLLNSGYAGVTLEGSDYKSDAYRRAVKNPAAIAFAVIFAVLFLGMLIALIVVCCCCKVVKKSTYNAAGGFAEMQTYNGAQQYGVDRENVRVDIADFSTFGANGGGGAGGAGGFGGKEAASMPPVARNGIEPANNM